MSICRGVHANDKQYNSLIKLQFPKKLSDGLSFKTNTAAEPMKNLLRQIGGNIHESSYHNFAVA